MTLVLGGLIDTRGEVRYFQQGMLGGSALAQVRLRDTVRDDPRFDLGYFEDVKSAVASYFGEDNPQEIVKFEEEKYLLVLFPSDVQGSFFDPLIPSIFFFLFEYQANDTLLLRDQWAQGIENLIQDRAGIWHDEDRVARDIVLASVQERFTAQVNGGTPLYYGVGVGSPPSYMSILGYEPDNIVAFTYRGEDYFFWYYLDKPEFGHELSRSVNISASFTFAEIINLFNIKVVR